MRSEIFFKIDELIKNVDDIVNDDFWEEISRRNNKIVPEKITNEEVISIFIKLVAFSQNANSRKVQKVLEEGKFKEIFFSYNIEEMIQMNPCDVIDEYWQDIAGIRQQSKIFHILMFARRIKEIGSFDKLLDESKMPKQNKSEYDIIQFWKSFSRLRKLMEHKKIPFLRSTTTLLHFLLEIGYDCVKPDLVVMKISKKLGISNGLQEKKQLITTVKTIQEYSLLKNIKPSVIDLYFLVDGQQEWAKKFIK